MKEENIEEKDIKEIPENQILDFLWNKGIKNFQQLSEIFEPNFYAVIPLSILENKKLSANSKLLYAEIVALSRKSGKCFATNKYLSQRIGISETTIPELIRALKLNSLILVNIIRNNQGSFRTITLNPSRVAEHTPPCERTMPLLVKEQGHNRTLTNRTLSVVEEDKSSSQTLQNSSQTKQPSELVIVRDKLSAYFIDRVKKQWKITPEINYSQLTILLKKFLTKYDRKQLKSLVDFYLDSDRYKEHGPNLGVVLSSYTINLWLQEKEAYYK